MDKVLMLMTEQHNFIRIRVSHLRALWIDSRGGAYLLYVHGVARPFELTEVSAKEAGEAMDIAAVEHV